MENETLRKWLREDFFKTSRMLRTLVIITTVHVATVAIIVILVHLLQS